jgi:hypothetical protein
MCLTIEATYWWRYPALDIRMSKMDRRSTFGVLESKPEVGPYSKCT